MPEQSATGTFSLKAESQKDSSWQLAAGSWPPVSMNNELFSEQLVESRRQQDQCTNMHCSKACTQDNHADFTFRSAAAAASPREAAACTE
jgi:hypothetical protein